jgi:hypothetical protein
VNGSYFEPSITYSPSIQPFCHLFQGPLILHTLTTHYCAIQGAVYIPAMGEWDDLVNQPYGALGMSAATVSVFPFSNNYIYSQQFFYRSNVPSHLSKTATSLLSLSDRARQNRKNWFSNRDRLMSRQKRTSVTKCGVRRPGTMPTWRKTSSMVNLKVSSSIQQNTIRRT